MATVMVMHWPEATLEQYEQARKEVNWEGDVPPGAKFHVTWIEEDGFHALDLWESQEAFQRFVQERLMPGVQKVGIQGQPNVRFYEANSVFAPDPT
jgi:hypothetical protein